MIHLASKHIPPSFKKTLLRDAITEDHRVIKRKPHGFTLIELLIVIVIISIVASFAVLSIHVNDNKRLENLAQQITNLFNLAEQEALYRPATLGVMVHDNKIRFYEYKPPVNEEKSPWFPVENSILNSLSIPNDIRIELKINDDIVVSNQPSIMISPGGEITAFTLLIGKKNSAPRYRVIGEDNGNISAGEIEDE